MTVGIAATLLVASSLGEPFSFAAEKSGALVHNVVPVPGRESEQSNAGSTSAFQMHVENAFHDCRPDYIVLACVRSDPAGDAGLMVSSIANAITTLSREVVEALFLDAYATSRPTSFGGGEPTIHPIMSGDPNDPNVRVDFAATRPLEEGGTADKNLKLLEEAVSAAAETVKLAAGDIAIVDNRVALHGRTAFQPRFDGSDRWLHRVYSSLDGRKSRGLRRDDSFVIE